MRHSFTLVWLSLAMALFAPVAARTQAMPAAIRPITEQVGAGFSYARPDYGESYIKGITVFGDVLYYSRFGLEANVHYDSLLTPTDIGENTFMVGPIVPLIRQDRLMIYARVLGGIARFQYKPNFPNPHTETYGAYAIGGGIQFRASKRVNIRAVDIEEQYWPSWSPHGLSPFVATFGAAYTFK